jgi:transcriptional regulator with XRE-family HTH domain
VRRTTGQGPSPERQAPAPIDPETGPGTRRFSPRRRIVTEGGSVYGTLVANERAKLGLTQSELAARIPTSPSTIARIEQGHPPSAELRKQLAVALNYKAPGPIRRAVSGLSPRGRLRRPSLSLGSRWLWGCVAVLNILIALILGGQMSDDNSSSASSLQPTVAVSGVIGAPAAIHRARVQAQKAAAAEARRAAALKREREAAAAAAAAAAARKAAANQAQSAPTDTTAVAAPVAPSPAPSTGGGGGGGGGGSSAPAPGLQHGIGAEGG